MNSSFSFIIQARSQSTRLPDKIHLPFCGNDTILDIQIKEIKAYFPETKVIIATSTNKADDRLANKYSTWKGLSIFRGNEDNVLDRFIHASELFSVENIVRICSDNPFLSMQHLEDLVNKYFKSVPDYISFRFKDGTPSIKSHSGLFAETTNYKTLKKVQQLTQEALYTEHVTNYIYSHPDKFRVEFIPVPQVLDNYIDKLRLTIDTKEDFIHLQKLYLAVLNKYGVGYSIEQLLSEVENDTELMKIMSKQIKQYAK